MYLKFIAKQSAEINKKLRKYVLAETVLLFFVIQKR